MVVQSTLKQAKPHAPCQARRRRTGSSTSRRSDEPTRLQYEWCGRAPSPGRARHKMPAKTTIRAAENQ